MRLAAQEHVSGLEQLAADYLGDRSKLRTMTETTCVPGCVTATWWCPTFVPRPSTPPATSPEAVSVPIADLESRLGVIPDGADVVAYCRGPYCVYADEAVRVLAEMGVAAARLEDGFPEWADAQLPVDRRTTGSWKKLIAGVQQRRQRLAGVKPTGRTPTVHEPPSTRR